MGDEMIEGHGASEAEQILLHHVCIWIETNRGNVFPSPRRANTARTHVGGGVFGTRGVGGR